MRNNIFFKKIAFVVFLVFTWNTIVMSAPEVVYRISIPEEYGRVKDRWKAQEATEKSNIVNGEKRTVIIVEDAHASSEAQFNLANIICALVPQIKDIGEQKTSCPFVGIEGAFGEYDLKELRDFPVYESKEIVGKQFVREGKFIGAELASILSSGDFTLYGIEEKELFKLNYQAFYKAAEKFSALENEISVIDAKLKSLKESVFSDELKAFDKRAASFECSEVDMLTYLPYLYEMIEFLQIDIFQYCILAQFQEVLSEKAFPESLDIGALLKDVEQCNNDIRNMFASTQTERKIIKLSQNIKLLKKMVALKATKEEVYKFRSNSNNFSAEEICAEINALAVHEKVSSFEFNAEVISLADNFYRLAEERDQAMVSNLLAKMEKEKQYVGVLVAGGYHSTGIKEILKSQGINYLTITPKINSISEDVAYMDRMMGHVVSVDPVMTSHLQVSRINAAVCALNEAGFEDILKDAGVQIKGQTFFDRQQINKIVEVLNEKDETIAIAFKQISREIYEKNLIENVLKNEETNANMVPAAMAALRRRLGKMVDDEVKLQKYLEAMENHFYFLMEGKRIGDTTQEQRLLVDRIKDKIGKNELPIDVWRDNKNFETFKLFLEYAVLLNREYLVNWQRSDYAGAERFSGYPTAAS